MVYEGDQLRIDMPLSDVSDLRVFGLDDTEETFAITELSSSRLVLTSDYARLTLRKF